jgi:ankyrin repeat protein
MMLALDRQVEQKAWFRCCMAAVLIWAASGFLGIAKGMATEGHQDIRMGVQRMVVGQSGWTALMEAAAQGNLAAVQNLLTKQSNVNAQAIDGSTALRTATYYGHGDVVNALLAHGADVNLRDERGRTALSDAVLEGRVAIASLLLDKGADPNVKTVFEEPLLTRATTQSDEDLVRDLLAHGADPNVQAEGHPTPLIAAVLKGRQKMISTLLEWGADSRAADRDGKSALLLAAEQGFTSTVHLLLKKGAPPDQLDTFGNSALILAAEHAHAPVAEALLKNGADVHLANKSGETAFLVSARIGAIAVMNILLQNGASANETTLAGTTALMMAAEKGRLDTVRYLIKNGAYVDAVDAEGNTAEVFADWAGHSEIVKVLLQQKTSSTPQGLPQTPATLFYIQSTKQHCVLKSFHPRDRSKTTLASLERCPMDVFVTKDFSALFLIEESEMTELVLRPRVHRAPSTPLPLTNTPNGGFGKHRLVQAGSFPDGSLGVLYESPLGDQASDMRLYKFHEERWTLVDEQHCPPFQYQCLKSPINGQSWKNWNRAKAIWHPRVIRNPFIVKRGTAQEGELSALANRPDYSSDDLGGKWRYLRLKARERQSTLFYYVLQGDEGFGPYTFTIFLRLHKDRNAVRIAENQCDTAIEDKYLLVNEYRLKLVDLETGKEIVTDLQYAFWNSN